MIILFIIMIVILTIIIQMMIMVMMIIYNIVEHDDNDHYMFNTGAAPPPMYPIPQEAEDTPRTYRSDKSKVSTNRESKIQEDSSPLTTAETIDALEKTFTYFKRAVVSPFFIYFFVRFRFTFE